MKKRELHAEIAETEKAEAEQRPEQPRELDDDDLKAVVGGWNGGGGSWNGGGGG